MKIEEQNVCKLEESITYDNLGQNDSLSASQIIMEKSSNFLEKKITLDEDTIFKFECLVEDDYISFKLSEIDAIAPYYYIVSKTIDEMRKVHKMFRSCVDLEEIKRHIDTLFKNNKIKLSQIKNEEIIIEVKAFYISIEDEFKIIAERKMVNYKDAMLLKLYEIQKNQLKILKNIEKFVEKDDVSNKEILEQIFAIKEKYNK